MVKEMEENRITYLQMIQSSIDRMSTSSAIFKGFAATVFIGLAAISFTEVSSLILWLSLIPVLCFAIMDVFYLQLERRYRYLYEQVRKGKTDVTFELAPPKVKYIKHECLQNKQECNVSIWSCIKSISISGFYPLLFLLGLALPILNICGVI